MDGDPGKTPDGGVALKGRRTILAPLMDRHIEVIHRFVSHPSMRSYWPAAGRTYSLETFKRSFPNSAAIQFVVKRYHSEDIVGVVQLTEVDYRSQHGKVSALFSQEYWRAGWPLEGLTIFINYLFQAVGIRKLYFEVPEYNLAHLGGAFGTWIREEGRLTNRLYARGKWNDLVIFALKNEEWDSEYAAWLLGQTSSRRIFHKVG